MAAAGRVKRELTRLFYEENSHEKLLIHLEVFSSFGPAQQQPQSPQDPTSAAALSQQPSGQQPPKAKKKRIIDRIGHSISNISEITSTAHSAGNNSNSDSPNSRKGLRSNLSTAGTASTNSAPSLPQPSLSKKKLRFICITQKSSGKIRIHKVKDLGPSSGFQIGKTWSLEEVKSIENLDPTRFTITLNKSYTWMVDEPPMKIEFMYVLVKLCSRVKKSPKLINLSEDLLQEEMHAYQNRQKNRNEDMTDFEVSEEIEGQGSTLEDAFFKVQFVQDDLNVDEVLTDYNWEVGGDSAALESRLMNELLALEAANIHAIIQAEEQANELSRMIDISIGDLNSVGGWLANFYNELMTMGKDIQQIESQNRGLQIQTVSQNLLKAELDILMTSLSLDDSAIESLQTGDLETSHGIEAIEKAADSLKNSFHTKINENLMGMNAVTDRTSLLTKHCNDFAQRLFNYLQKLIIRQVDANLSDDLRRSSIRAETLCFEPEESVWENLIPYRNLVVWLREMDNRKYSELQTFYVENVNRIYKKQSRELAEFLKTHLVKKVEDSKHLFTQTTRIFGTNLTSVLMSGRAGSVANILTKGHKKSVSGDTGSVYNLSLSGTSGDDNSKLGRLRTRLGGSFSTLPGGDSRMLVDEAFQQYIEQLIPIMMKEQNFLVNFFVLNDESNGVSVDQMMREMDSFQEIHKDVKHSKKVEYLISKLFESILDDALSWLEAGIKCDLSFLANILLRIETIKNRTVKTTGGSMCQLVDIIPFLSTFTNALHDKALSIFETFLDEQLTAIDETKLTIKNRSGILSFVRVYPNYVAKMEAFFKNTEDTSDLEKFPIRKLINDSYAKIANLIYDNLEAIAKDVDSSNPDDREQLNAHILLIENMHHIYSEVRGLKITCLEQHLKTAKLRYDSHLNSYIRAVVRKPLGKLLLFFEGIEELLKTKQPEEISFHISYSRSSLKKCLASFPGKEIKKSLETLYKRVEKHFCEEEGLLQVVWHGIQEEFIRMHQNFESLIALCYPNSDIHLMFSVQDLCDYFSDMAKSH